LTTSNHPNSVPFSGVELGALMQVLALLHWSIIG
jgi:hypothetical protein